MSKAAPGASPRDRTEPLEDHMERGSVAAAARFPRFFGGAAHFGYWAITG
jgi:hypothetical protein